MLRNGLKISMFSFDSVWLFLYTLAMKTVLSLIFIFLMPFSVSAHPGKTDYRGGHKCWKNCGEWELQRGEYHLHDKNWKPIRLDQKGNVLETEQTKGVPIPEKRFLLEEPSEQPVEPVSGVRKNSEDKGVNQQTTVEKHYAVTVYEESILPFNTIMLILLAFLMLIVLIFLRKKREKE